MSKRDRNQHRFSQLIPLFLASCFFIVLCLTAFWGVAWTLSRNAANAERYAQYYAANAADQIQERCFLTDSMTAKCIREIVESTHEHQRAEADLEAQRNMAQWALWVVVVSLASILVGAVGIFFVYRTLRETRKGNKINRRIGQAQVRAYVEIEKASVMFRRPFSFFDRYRPEIWIDIANHGSSPALDYRWNVEISYGYTDTTGVKFLGPAPAQGEGLDIPATGKSVRLKRDVTHDVTGDEDRALKADGLRVFVSISAFFTDVFDNEVPRTLHFFGDVKRMGENAFGCDLQPMAQDNESARKYGVTLRETVDTINAFNRNLSAAADEAERIISEAKAHGDDARNHD